MMHCLPGNFFQAIVTSLLYLGHRKYAEDAIPNEIGQENDPDTYIANIVDVFSQLKSKLKPNGLLWLNLGDTYREKSLLGIPWRDVH